MAHSQYARVLRSMRCARRRGKRLATSEGRGDEVGGIRLKPCSAAARAEVQGVALALAVRTAVWAAAFFAWSVAGCLLVEENSSKGPWLPAEMPEQGGVLLGYMERLCVCVCVRLHIRHGRQVDSPLCLLCAW